MMQFDCDVLVARRGRVSDASRFEAAATVYAARSPKRHTITIKGR